MSSSIKMKDYGKARALFASLEEFQPMCTAVLEGIWPGRVWVDDPDNPQSAMMMSFLSGGGAAWCFLAGKSDIVEFNMYLNKTIFEEKAAGKDVGFFFFTCSPEDRGGQLEIIGNSREPIPMLRQHYVCRELTYDPWGNQPDGYTILPMESELLERDELQIPSQVKNTLEKWGTIENERFQDYGFVVEYKNQIVAWATVDFVTSGSGDLGFETLPDFQQRGLGSGVAAAALEHGLERGVKIHWTCATDNIGSQKSAKKLGLVCEQEYTMYLFALDTAEHLAQLAYSFLARGQHRQAIESYEQLFAQKEVIPSWAYFDTAQAWAALEESKKAIHYLRMAAEHGWSAVDETEQTPEFHILHNSPDWGSVIEQIRTNKTLLHHKE
ncbi:MAG: GNAT family N-acetyltransferase [Anaerolineae bacterium]|nr:GNAT family N-acetyltransferase [Anaerolineae bacterium]MBL6966355.1 GNAT family N-acetyltransferase [Anaerolineales bacterium]